MEAERLYTKQPSRTIQQKRGGEGALEMVDNRPAGILQAMSEHPIQKQSVIQMQNILDTERVDLSIYGKEKLNKIILCGDSFISGVHQEIMCEFEKSVSPTSKMYLRFSRNNAKDTAMVTNEKRLNDLKSKKIDTNVDAALQVFCETHNLWPKYDQADCQLFAQKIFSNITGESFENDDDYDFM